MNSDASASKGASWSGIALRVEGLAAVRGQRLLFENVSFEAQSGDILELRGPNGSGKSTLLRILAGLTRPAAGQVRLSGTEDLHLLGHLDAIKPGESALQQAAFWGRFHGRGADVVKASLERVGLAGRARVPGRGLSAGQRRRLALARLLIEPRPVWLLDEPTAALDAEGARMLRVLAAEHVAGGGLIIAAVHGEGLPGARTFELGTGASIRTSVA